MTKTSTYPIVGAHFRPPAKGILAAIPAEQALLLRPEPTNPYDSNAIQVLIQPDSIPEAFWAEVDTECRGFGSSWEEIKELEEVHLGYIPRDLAAVLQPKFSRTESGGFVSVPGKLAFNAKGDPMVSFALSE